MRTIDLTPLYRSVVGFDRLAALYPEFRNLRAYLEVFDFRNVINLRA